ncbi:outer membrane protein TolC [Granulicella aggregans]|uniref:Outer membrane protein TolC n=2 Tax=Granulicella aggregans TaxID=474949 RepID=A0A7W8E723_9BACT|nr:outer membrane protein TolC [Granulicella aggregans]
MTQRGRQRSMLRFPSLLLAATALLAPCVTSQAQISFSSAVDLALRSDPKIKAADAGIEKARAALSSVRDTFIPSASANGGYGTSTGVPLGVPVVFSLSSQSQLFSFAQRDNTRAATAALQAALLAAEESRDQVTEDVAVTYLNLDNSQRRQAAMAQEYSYAQKLTNIVQDRLEAGHDARIELLKAKRTAAQIHLQLLQIEDQITGLSDHLSRLVGLPGNRLSSVSSSIPSLPAITTLTGDAPDSFGVQSSMAVARSKQYVAFGEEHYRFRPQISFSANYSRISTSHTNYIDYYPGFKQMSESAASIGIGITLPLYDRLHEDRARETAAEAHRAQFEAEDQRNQFLEGRARLQHSAQELAARSDLAGIDRELAQEQLDIVLAQLSADNGSSGGPLMTPKDEQNARLQERARAIDLLEAEFQLNQAQINLMRQTGQLDTWLKNVDVRAVSPSSSTTITPAAGSVTP